MRVYPRRTATRPPVGGSIKISSVGAYDARVERRPFPEWSVPAWRPALVALALASAGLPAGRAQAAVVAVDPLGAAAPVLWNGGVAWQDTEGVRAATVGSPPRRLVSFRPLGFTYDFSLDSGSGANGTAT